MKSCGFLVFFSSLLSFLGSADGFVSHAPEIAAAPRLSCTIARAGVTDLPEGDTVFQQEVLQATGPVLVDFYAEWCGPCRLVEGIVKKLAVQYEGQLKVVKVNTEVHKSLVGEYRIQGLPLLKVFKDGQVVGTHEGAAGMAQLQKLVLTALPELAAT